MIGDQVVESVANEKDEEESADHADMGKASSFVMWKKTISIARTMLRDALVNHDRVYSSS